MSSFELDCPVLRRLVWFKFQLEPDTDMEIYIHMYTNPDRLFLAPTRSLEISQECSVFRCADLATLYCVGCWFVSGGALHVL